MTSRERAYLRGLANDIESILQVGKQGVTPEVVESVAEALESRELIKITVLSNSGLSVKEASILLSERTRSECIQVIGKKIILYKKSKTSNTNLLTIK